MDILDPNTWTAEYVVNNYYDCFARLSEVNEKVIFLFRKGDSKAAVAGMDRMINGAVTIHNSLSVDMSRFLAANSFCEGLLITCAMDSAPDAKRRESAAAAFEDARSFSPEYDGETTRQYIRALSSGRSFGEIRDGLCPRYWNDVESILKKNYDLLRAARDSLTQEVDAQRRRSRRRKLIIIAVSLAITLTSAFTTAKVVSGNQPKSSGSGGSSYSVSAPVSGSYGAAYRTSHRAAY